ncbi:MAG: HEAT repeat domain-containing protein, partial [Myxococcota bacterium]
SAKKLILGQLEAGGNGPERGQLLSILSRIGGPEVLEVLSREATTGGPNARNSALWVLSQSEDPGATDALLALVREAPEGRRAEYVSMLAGRDDPESRAMLAEFAAADGETGAMALSMLSLHAPEQARALAVEALQSPDAARRAQALGVLGQTGGDDTFAMAEKALGDADTQVQVQALSVLSTFVDERATQAVLKAYREGSDDLRSSATWMLGATGHPEATKLLLDSALNGSDQTRYGALSALTQSADGPTMDKLFARASVQDDRGREIRQHLVGMGLIEGDEPAGAVDEVEDEDGLDFPVYFPE